MLITIHVGLHKTGTSAIQIALGLASHRRGLLVSRPVFDRDGIDSHWAQRIRTKAKSRHVVASSEGLLGNPFTGYDDLVAKACDLSGVVGSEEFRIVVYLRPQTEWIPSIYLQEVQEGSAEDPLSFWERLRACEHVHWVRLVGCLTRTLGPEAVTVRPYVSGTDVVRDFFATAGLGEAPVVGRGAIRENVSISPAQAAIMRALNENDVLTSDQRRRIRTLLQNVVSVPSSTGLSPFPPEVQLDIRQAFQDDWGGVAELLSGRAGKEEFREAIPKGSHEIKPYAGSIPKDEPSVTELLRIVGELGLRDDLVRNPSVWQRALSKAHSNPRDIPFAALRRIQGYGR